MFLHMGISSNTWLHHRELTMGTAAWHWLSRQPGGLTMATLVLRAGNLQRDNVKAGIEERNDMETPTGRRLRERNACRESLNLLRCII